MSAMTNDFGEFIKFFDALTESVRAIDKKNEIAIPDLPSDATASDKRAALKTVLESIAEIDPSSAIDDDDAEKLADFFEALYEPVNGVPFRHMYSEVCETMYRFLSDEGEKSDDGVPYKAVQLANSAGIVVRVLEGRDPEGKACKGARKLLDHINLELTRMRYMAKQNKALDAAIEKTEELSNEYGSRIEEIGNETEETLKGIQKQYITILGIFAAIILAFTSGATFSSSVLENIDNASIYRISFVVALVGLFMFFMITSLFMFINRSSGIDNSIMLVVLVTGTAAFLILIVMIILARAIDIVALFPIWRFFV